VTTTETEQRLKAAFEQVAPALGALATAVQLRRVRRSTIMEIDSRLEAARLQLLPLVEMSRESSS
jgi:hypothetical protein